MICGDPVKDWIVEYLSISVAVPIKAIALWLNDAGYSISQAQVYNIITSMLDAKMLTKQQGKVRLSAWRIESIEEMAARFSQQRDRDGIATLAYGEKKVFEAKTFHELNAIWHDISAQLLTGYQGDVYYYDPHPYHLLGEYTREKVDLLKAKKEKYHLWYIIWWTSFLDRYGAQLAQENGVEVLCIDDSLFAAGEFCAVVGEYIYTITLDKKVVDYFELFFSTIISLEQFRHDLFYDLFGMKWVFTYTLVRNPSLAGEIQDRFRALFEKKKNSP